MNSILFIILMTACAVVFFKALIRYEEVLQFPFLITCDLMLFLGPQLFYILKNPDVYRTFNPSSLTLFLSICLLFYVSAIMGYSRPAERAGIPFWHFEKKKMIYGLLVLSLIGQYGKFKLNSLSDELTSSTQWTGLPVRYLFFSNVGALCIPLGIILYYTYKNKVILGILLMEMAGTISHIIFHGKRSPAAFLALMILTGLWFVKRYKISKGVIIFSGIIFFMFVTNVGTYRALMKQEGEKDWGQVFSEVFDLEKTIDKFTQTDKGSGSGHADALNGVVAAGAVFESSRYDYGLYAWNVVVHRWIPSQLVGRGLKNALKFDTGGASRVAFEEYEYNLKTGTCVPGYTEVFAAFSFLGVFFMYFFGKAARSIWDQAMQGNLIAQILHFALAPIYLRFGGGGIWALLGGLFFWVIFLLPILWWAKEPASIHYEYDEYPEDEFFEGEYLQEGSLNAE